MKLAVQISSKLYWTSFLFFFASDSDGIQPKSDGLQPTGDSLQPRSDGLQMIFIEVFWGELMRASVGDRVMLVMVM